MKICLYTGSALPKLGGQEAVVDSLARNYLQLGHEPIVLAPRPRLPLWPRDSGLPYRVIRHPRFFSTKHFVSGYRWFLLHANRRYGFDVIHCHDVYPTGYVASLLREMLNIPVVITSHGGDVRAGNVRLTKPGMRERFTASIRSADALVSIGRFTTEGFLQLGAEAAKIRVIPNGVDLAPFKERVDRPGDLDRAIQPEKYLMFLGRISPRKGLDVLLRALALLPATGGIELVVAGTGDGRVAIQNLIGELKLSNRVRMTGRVSGDHKTWLLQNALCLVVPSRGWEAFPLVVLEGYAARRPVIGSRIAGLEDVIFDQQTGLLFQAESAADLANALRQVREDSEWVQEAGAAGRAHAEEFGWDRIAGRHLELYRQLMHGREGHGPPPDV